MKFRHKILCISLFIMSCSTNPIKYVPQNKSIDVIDFSTYTKNGFLITPYNYLGDYEAVGIFQIVITPEAKAIEVKVGRTQDGKEDIIKNIWKIQKITSKELFDTLYAEASKMGANAIVDLKINEIKNDIINDPLATSVPSVSIYGIKISGFAIKRLGAFKNENEK